jgi:hypothetical protein
MVGDELSETARRLTGVWRHGVGAAAGGVGGVDGLGGG